MDGRLAHAARALVQLAETAAARQASIRIMALPDRIALVGFMGSGKSTVGGLLAAAVGYRLVDVDALIEAQAGTSIPEIFRREGEASFRERESRLLLGLAEQRGLVIATGGGAPMRPHNREFLRTRCRTFYLEISVAEVRRRLGADTGRPLLAATQQGVEELLAKRRRWYAAVGDTVSAEGRTPAQVVAAIRALL